MANTKYASTVIITLQIAIPVPCTSSCLFWWFWPFMWREGLSRSTDDNFDHLDCWVEGNWGNAKVRKSYIWFEAARSVWFQCHPWRKRGKCRLWHRPWLSWPAWETSQSGWQRKERPRRGRLAAIHFCGWKWRRHVREEFLVCCWEWEDQNRRYCRICILGRLHEDWGLTWRFPFPFYSRTRKKVDQREGGREKGERQFPLPQPPRCGQSPCFCHLCLVAPPHQASSSLMHWALLLVRAPPKPVGKHRSLSL